MEYATLIFYGLLGSFMGTIIALALKRMIVAYIGKSIVSTLISYCLLLIGIIFLLKNNDIRNSELAIAYKAKLIHLTQIKV